MLGQEGPGHFLGPCSLAMGLSWAETTGLRLTPALSSGVASDGAHRGHF